ncbi:MAG: cytochrome C oxidase subunit IV family protein [Planctomycetota bacterium]
MSTAHAEHEYNPADPHGFHAADDHHGHVIVPWQTLLGVLLTLLVFTVITVFQAQFEKHAAYVWGWDIPGWVNIVLAMAIATVKGALVVLFFMQLWWDRGVNALLFLFTIFAVWLFLMFTMIDLSGRTSNVEWRGGEIVAGGSGVGIDREGFGSSALHVTVRENYIAEKGLTQAEYDKKAAEKHSHKHLAEHNSKDHSRVRSGLTPGLFDTGPWAALDGDGEKKDGDH